MPVNAQTLIEVLPFHILLDSNLFVRQAGLMIQRVCPILRNNPNKDPVNIVEVATLISPTVTFNAVNIDRFRNASFVLRLNLDVKGNGSDLFRNAIYLKGK